MATESDMRPSPAASHVQTKLASPKRGVETPSPVLSVQDAADTTPQKRRKMTLPAYHRSQEFWYPDGNIVVIVNKVGHKVHLSRLQRLCGFFKDQFPIAPERTESTGDDDDSQALQTAPQSYILTDVNLADFQEVLRTLETPLRFNTEPMSQDVALCLLRAGTRLQCGAAVDAAKARLCQLWPVTPPAHEEQGVVKPKDILAVIDAARKYAVPAALKRALYVLMLYHARHVLQHEWSTLLFAVPGEAQSGRCFIIGPEKCQLVEREARAGRWRTMFIDRGHWEKGLKDPVGYVETVAEIIRKSETSISGKGVWCALCLRNRKQAFLAAR
ncbi:hypothetical protein ONZ51_g8263 [Trametes cubensis]|uniref:BTB domain-containing protein n=1 Tax=Trametes cubensis TaxID=1111947 RepID=A0AAD7XAZ2_9APHY|nr:hypothetical protein ONZ51_g8263 [Trametes cubensis]